MLRGSDDTVDVECGVAYPHHEDARLLPAEDNARPDPLGRLIPVVRTATKRRTSKPSESTDAARPPRRDDAPGGAASKILFLDGLRGLAAMLVVAQHVSYIYGVSVGQPAVDTFFVLSAFLLTMIFEKKARTLFQQNASYRRWGWALLDYFSRRFLRVYPLFAVVAIFLTVYSPEQKEKLFFVHHPEEYNLWKVLTFDTPQRYHVFWTLPLEITYYFIIPIFVVGMLKLKKFWFVPMLPMCYLIAYAGFYWPRGDHMPLKPHLPTFLCGSLAAFIYSKMDQWITANQFVFRWYHKLALRFIEMCALSLLLSSIFVGLLFTWVFTNPITGPGNKFVSTNVSTIIICEMLLPGAISSVLEWSLLRYAGKVSFSMYLLHSFVIYSDWLTRQSFYDRLVVLWALVFLLSAVSYHLIEYPCQVLAGKVGAAIKKKDALELLSAKPSLPVVSGHGPNHTHHNV